MTSVLKYTALYSKFPLPSDDKVKKNATIMDKLIAGFSPIDFD